MNFTNLWCELLIVALSLIQNMSRIFQRLFFFLLNRIFQTHSETFLQVTPRTCWKPWYLQLISFSLTGTPLALTFVPRFVISWHICSHVTKQPLCFSKSFTFPKCYCYFPTLSKNKQKEKEKRKSKNIQYFLNIDTTLFLLAVWWEWQVC